MKILEERRRTHDLFPAVALRDLFLQRVREDGVWSLFDPSTHPEMSNSFGDEFNKLYLEAEHNKEYVEQHKAKEIWKRIINQYFETGNPFLFNKDEANRRNPNGHKGIIRSSNLCTEIFQNTKPAEYGIHVIFEDGTEDFFEHGPLELDHTTDTVDAYRVNGTIYPTDTNVNIGDTIGVKRETLESNATNTMLDSVLTSKLPTQLLGMLGNFNVQGNKDILKVLVNRGRLIVEQGLIKGFSVELFDIDSIRKVQHHLSLYNIGSSVFSKQTRNSAHTLFINGADLSLLNTIFKPQSIKKYTRLLDMLSTDTVLDIVEQVSYKTESIIKEAKHLHTGDTFNGKRIVFAERYLEEEAEVAVCNLLSINLSRVNTEEDMERVVPIAMRMLDNIIDLNIYPINSARLTNQAYRAVGLGMMGEAELIATKQLTYGSEEHYHYIGRVYELFSYNAIESSIKLAEERGAYPNFKGSDWSKGILPIHTANKQALGLHTNTQKDFDELGERAKAGVRNGYMMAVAPTSAISIICGTTSTTEPVYKRSFLEENLSGQFRVVVPNLNPDTWAYYPSAYDVCQVDRVKHASLLSVFLDQGASTNIFISKDNASGKYINNVLLTGLEYGLKSTYYLRSTSPEAEDETMQQEREKYVECRDCQ